MYKELSNFAKVSQLHLNEKLEHTNHIVPSLERIRDNVPNLFVLPKAFNPKIKSGVKLAFYVYMYENSDLYVPNY